VGGMANHKRGRARNARAGCKMCKTHKVAHVPEKTKWRHSEWRRIRAAQEQVLAA